VYTLHSELATFPFTFPGLRAASFRLSLAPALAERVELLARCGLADLEPVDAGGVSVAPRAVLLASVARRGAAVPPSNRTTAVHVIDAEGVAGGRPATVRATAVTAPYGRWALGGGVVSTAAPAAEAARPRRCGTHGRARPRAGVRAGAVPPRPRHHRLHGHPHRTRRARILGLRRRDSRAPPCWRLPTLAEVADTAAFVARDADRGCEREPPPIARTSLCSVAAHRASTSAARVEYISEVFRHANEVVALLHKVARR
jgi:hypothetical protein